MINPQFDLVHKPVNMENDTYWKPFYSKKKWKKREYNLKSQTRRSPPSLHEKQRSSPISSSIIFPIADLQIPTEFIKDVIISHNILQKRIKESNDQNNFITLPPPAKAQFFIYIKENILGIIGSITNFAYLKKNQK